MLRVLVICLSFFLFQACSNDGSYQETVEKLDKVYGKCDNPQRKLRPLEYKICKDKERAAGPDGEIGEAMDITGIFNRGGSGTVYAGSDTNTFLWDASLKTLKNYSIKISDFDGGYIESNWIKKENVPNERCLIKTHIVSSELISTGVEVNFVCEKLIDNDWYSIDQSYVEEEKQLILKILSEASKISTSNPQ